MVIELFAVLMQSVPWPVADVGAMNKFFGYISGWSITKGRSVYFMYIPFLAICLTVLALYITTITLAIQFKRDIKMNDSIVASIRYVILSLCYPLCIPITLILSSPMMCSQD